MVKILSSEIFQGEFISELNRFSFPLSAFQQNAIQGIVEGKHVLVTAPTGSGKTLPAEFAIAYFTEQNKKVIYTSPIKALSNQKFYEFQKKFPEISFGLITGDNKINPAAQVLLMTTEILMNSLFLLKENQTNQVNQVNAFQMDIKQECACVIFDEVHYINDEHRGHVWEKSLMMLSAVSTICMVMLSATMHEPIRFAKWIESCSDMQQKREVVVCSTNHRVVPLGHYSFVTATESLFKKLKDKATEQEYRRDILNKLLPLQDAQGKFHETTLSKVQKVLHSLKIKQVDIRRKFVMNQLLEHLRDNDMLPALTFILSRKQVELCAQEITANLLPFDSKIPYVTRQECEKVLRDTLPNWQEYTVLPEYDRLVSLLEKGIGIHHSGMIPVFREMVELWISRKAISLLIATESFAIGLDCPIKTVIFTSFNKFDGSRERLLESHEYKQMAGRAGRRGLDKIGYVVHCSNLFSPLSPIEYRQLLGGKPLPFHSKLVMDKSLVLKMISHGQTTMTEMLSFVETSYGNKTLQDQLNQEQQQLLIMKEKWQQEKNYVEKLGTPWNECLEACQMLKGMSMATHKKQKEWQKTMDKARQDYKTFDADVHRVSQFLDLEQQIVQESNHILAGKEWWKNDLQETLQVLQQKGAVILNSQDQQDHQNPQKEWRLTPLGERAASFQEVDGLMMAEWIETNSWFQDIDIYHLVGLLAILCWEQAPTFTATEECANNTQDNVFLDYVQYWIDEKVAADKSTLLSLAGPLMEWCDCNNQEECRLFLQKRMIEERNISIGDFVKIVLKMMAIRKEWERVAEKEEQVSFLHKLSQVDALICKYVATCQSLYL